MSTGTITIKDTATPVLKAIRETEHDKAGLHKFISLQATELVRTHLFNLNRHATAQRLGATPTGYMEAKGNNAEPAWDDRAAYVRLPTGGGAEAFARVWGDVTVTPVKGKYLTLPAIAAAYGQRARTFPDLVFVPFGNGTKALCRREIGTKPGKKKAEIKDVKLIPFFWLRESVFLKQDRTLLPSDEQFAAAAETGAEEWLAFNLAQVAEETPLG